VNGELDPDAQRLAGEPLLSSASVDPGPIELRFVGPFAMVPMDGQQHYRDAPEARGPGLYIQGLSLQTRFLAAYVGETGGAIADRLDSEVRLWMRGKDRRRRQFSELDDVAYAAGVRRYALSEVTEDVAIRMRDNVLRATTVILATSELDRGDRRCVEAELIRRIHADPRARRFIYNTIMKGRLLHRPLRISLPEGARVPGLHG
jgi:Arc/MetJ family transcription regulator